MFKIRFETLEGSNPTSRWVRRVIYLNSTATRKLLHRLLFSHGTAHVLSVTPVHIEEGSPLGMPELEAMVKDYLQEVTEKTSQ